jgi:hypothetical protein
VAGYAEAMAPQRPWRGFDGTCLDSAARYRVQGPLNQITPPVPADTRGPALSSCESPPDDRQLKGDATRPILLPKRLEAQDLQQDRVQQAVGAVDAVTILRPAAEAVLIAATEALAKVVVVVDSVYVIAVVTVVCVLIGIQVLVAAAPSILPVCLCGQEALLVTEVHGLPQDIRAVLICVVGAAATAVAIDRSRVEVRIAVVIGVAVILERLALLTEAGLIVLLKAVLRRAPLLL